MKKEYYSKTARELFIAGHYIQAFYHYDMATYIEGVSYINEGEECLYENLDKLVEYIKKFERLGGIKNYISAQECAKKLNVQAKMKFYVHLRSQTFKNYLSCQYYSLEEYRIFALDKIRTLQLKINKFNKEHGTNYAVNPANEVASYDYYNVAEYQENFSIKKHLGNGMETIKSGLETIKTNLEPVTAATKSGLKTVKAVAKKVKSAIQNGAESVKDLFSEPHYSGTTRYSSHTYDDDRPSYSSRSDSSSSSCSRTSSSSSYDEAQDNFRKEQEKKENFVNSLTENVHFHKNRESLEKANDEIYHSNLSYSEQESARESVRDEYVKHLQYELSQESRCYGDGDKARAICDELDSLGVDTYYSRQDIFNQ